MASQITQEKQGFQKFYVLSEQKASDESGIHLSKVSKKTRSAHSQQVSIALTPGKGALASEEGQRWGPGNGRN